MTELGFQLAKEYTDGMKIPKSLTDLPPPLSWWMSEKYDGYRARIHPELGTLVTRQNKPLVVPEWFINATKTFKYNPDGELLCYDGELFAGRDNFQKMGVVRRKDPSDEDWFPIKYVVYDFPEMECSFDKRYAALKLFVDEAKQRWTKFQKTNPKFVDVSCPIVLCEQHKVESIEQMNKFYENIISNEGEGIMLKHPTSLCEKKRSSFLLKFKPKFDAEAIIVGYKDGTGKYTDMLGAFQCKPLINAGNYQVVDDNPEHIFAISGMNDEIRENYKETHPINTIVTFQYAGYTKAGIPRFANYLRKREDVVIKDKSPNKCVDVRNNVIDVFNKISKYYKINGDSIKSRSYSKGIEALKLVDDDIDLTEQNLSKLKGIGPSLLGKIMEVKETGTCQFLEKIQKDDPKELFQKIYGVGPKKANELVKMGFSTIDDIVKSEKLDIFNEKQLLGIKYYDDINTRIPRKEIEQHEQLLIDIFGSIDPDGDLTIAGSYRRGKPDSGDIDVLIKTDDIAYFKRFIEELFSHKYLTEELANGRKKFMGLCKLESDLPNRRIDIMYTRPDEYPFAILYFTGSKEFNQKMRQHANEKGFTLNEHGIEEYSEDPNAICNPIDPNDIDLIDEKGIFDLLEYDYVHPTKR